MKACLAAAVERADALHHKWVRSEHVLEAIMAHGDSDAARALLAAGVMPGSLEGQQEGRLATGTVAFSAEHRESVLSGGLAGSLLQGCQGVTIDGVILGGVARRRTARSGT